MDYTYIFDVATRLAELVTVGPPTDHLQGRALYVDDHVKVLAFPFAANQTFDEHVSPHPVMLHFVQGEAKVTLGDDAMEAHPGTWIHLSAQLSHSIHARTPVVMLLIVLRNG